MAAYQKSIDQEQVPAEAYKNLGYLYLKSKDISNAQANFRKYLEADPEASDWEMIEFYLEEDSR